MSGCSNMACSLSPSTICFCLQADTSADKHLLTFNPKLRGKGAVVNKGDIQISKLPFAPSSRPYPQKLGDLKHKPVAHAYDPDFDD